MSFRNLTYYFIHQALAGFTGGTEDCDECLAPEKGGWEKNTERGSDLNKLARPGNAIADLEPERIELMSEAGRQRLEQITDLLEQARNACRQL